MAVTSLVSDKCNSLSAFDENFGMELNFNNIRRQFREWVEKQSTSGVAAKMNDSEACVTTLNDKYEVTIDVYQFRSEEITIKVIGSNIICIEGNHEEQHDNSGFISRKFVRKYTLPNGYDIKNVVSTLSSDGILRIMAPRNGHTTDEYHNTANQQINSTLQCRKQAQYNEEGIQKCVSDYQETPVSTKNITQEHSIFQNQQVNHDRKQNEFSAVQNSKETEQTHGYIQKFLHNIDNTYKVIPIKQVGPFSKSNEHIQPSRVDTDTVNISSQQRQETFKNQKECHIVPIIQTNTTNTRSFETETKKQVGTNCTAIPHQTTQTKQTTICDTVETSNVQNEPAIKNRMSSIDVEDKYVQKEVVRAYKTIPIEQIDKQSQSTTELTKTQNIETNVASQGYKTISIEQAGAAIKSNPEQEKTFQKCNTTEVTATSKNGKQIPCENYKTVTIQQTEISWQGSSDQMNKHIIKDDCMNSQRFTDTNTTHLEKIDDRNINKMQSNLNAPQEQKVLPEARNGKENMTTIVPNKDSTQKAYKTIPIKQIVNILEENERTIGASSTNSHCDIKNTTETEIYEQRQNSANALERLQTGPTEHAPEKHKHPHIPNSEESIASIEETTTLEMYSTLDCKRNPNTNTEDSIIDKGMQKENIFKNTSNETQCNNKSITNFGETQAHGSINTLQEDTAIKQTTPNKGNKLMEYYTKNEELVESTIQNKNEIYDWKNNPTDCVGTLPEQTKHETNKQNILKTDSFESQCTTRNETRFNETKNWECNSSKTQKGSNNTSQNYETISTEKTDHSSLMTGEQKLYENNVSNTNKMNKQPKQTDIYQGDRNNSQETHSSSKKTSESTQESSSNSYLQSKNLLESSNHDTQINKHNKLQLDSTKKNELISTSQNEQQKLVFHESDSSKEDSVVDGYKQKNFINQNAKAEFVTLPHGFKVTKEQSFYSEQTRTKDLTSNKFDKQVDQGQNNTYQVQYSVDSNNSERLSRRPSETSEICIEEVTEGSETTVCSGSSSGYRKHEASQFVSNSDHKAHLQHN